MKIRTLALALTSLASAAVFAAAPSAAGAVPAIGETVAQLESRYPGKVVAIASTLRATRPRITTSTCGSRGAGWRGWTWTPRRSRSRRANARRSRPGPQRSPTPRLCWRAAVPGEILVAELDAATGAAPHYDVDVRLPEGAVARLKVDSATRRIDWRMPAIITDWPGASANDTLTVRPRPGAVSEKTTVAPCSSAMRLTMDRPSPAPEPAVPSSAMKPLPEPRAVAPHPPRGLRQRRSAPHRGRASPPGRARWSAAGL